MKRGYTLPILQAIFAAVLFGASAPFSKLLLGEIDPLPLAGFLYLGSGIAASVFLLFQKIQANPIQKEAGLSGKDLPWLLGAVFAGGVIAPVILLLGLQSTPAATASLLLNFESVATTLIAFLIFKEAVGKRIFLAMVLVTLASIFLTLNTNGNWGFSLGAFGVLSACIFWGFDNNFTRNISAKNPLSIVSIKGLGAGTFSIILCLILGISLPTLNIILLSMLLGSLSYGLSIYLFILAMRNLGAARTSTLFGIAPFIGALLSITILKEAPQVFFWVSMPLIITGAYLMFSEEHQHLHVHEPFEHEHRHFHPDEHHQHTHRNGMNMDNQAHTHIHKHDILEHTHAHSPDIHHRHSHIA